MRTAECIAGRHRYCPGAVLLEPPHSRDCSCQCHPRARKAVRRKVTQPTRIQVRERDRYRCVATIPTICRGTPDHVHHVRLASLGGGDTEENLITVCWPCHAWIHDHPTVARELGLLR